MRRMKLCEPIDSDGEPQRVIELGVYLKERHRFKQGVAIIMPLTSMIFPA